MATVEPIDAPMETYNQATVGATFTALVKPPTSVTELKDVTEVKKPTFATMRTSALTAIVADAMIARNKAVDNLIDAEAEVGRIDKSILHPALLVIRERYRAQGARTDLIPGQPTFADYLKSIKLSESLLRVWDFRKAKELKRLTDGTPKPKPGRPAGSGTKATTTTINVTDPKVEAAAKNLASAQKRLGAPATTGSDQTKEIITHYETDLAAAQSAPAPSAPTPAVIDTDCDEPVTYSPITELADLNIQTDSERSQGQEIETIPIVDVEPDVIEEPEEASWLEEEAEEKSLPQYRVRLVVEGKRLTSVKKHLRTMFPELSPDDIEVERIDARASRMDRLCEAMSLVNDAKETVDDLAGELQEWRDNMPEPLQQGEKASELEEAISALENLSGELENINWDVEFPSMMG